MLLEKSEVLNIMVKLNVHCVANAPTSVLSLFVFKRCVKDVLNAEVKFSHELVCVQTFQFLPSSKV